MTVSRVLCVALLAASLLLLARVMPTSAGAARPQCSDLADNDREGRSSIQATQDARR
jgi:hypothetical protein